MVRHLYLAFSPSACSYVISGLTDSSNRGCIITDKNQIQCDEGAAAQSGFTIGCDGKLAYKDTSSFTACPTEQDGGYNIYTKAPEGQAGCVSVTLGAGDAPCKADCSPPPPPPSPKPAPPAPPPPKSCPNTLTGEWEYPHLIVPVDSANPDKEYGTQYNGTISPTVSSIFDFDIPATAQDKTCSLVFLFPDHKDLQTSNYYFSGSGALNFQPLAAPATEGTTYNTQPDSDGAGGYGLKVSPGNSYAVTSFTPCPAGRRVAVKMSTSSDTCLSWFQDYNPSP